MDETFDILDEERGLYSKYRAVKIPEDGVPSQHKAGCSKDCPTPEQWHYANCAFNTVVTDPDPGTIKINGHIIEEVTEPFFLLKFDDPYAREALYAYAKACAHQYPTLAADIRKKLLETYQESETEYIVNNMNYNKKVANVADMILLEKNRMEQVALSQRPLDEGPYSQ